MCEHVPDRVVITIERIYEQYDRSLFQDSTITNGRHDAYDIGACIGNVMCYLIGEAWKMTESSMADGQSEKHADEMLRGINESVNVLIRPHNAV